MVITVISGTSDEGLKWALERINLPDASFDFTGALAFISSRFEIFEQSIPRQINLASLVSEVTGEKAAIEAVVPTNQPTQMAESIMDKFVPQPKAEQPMWGTYLIIGIIIIGVIIAVISIIRTARGGRRP